MEIFVDKNERFILSSTSKGNQKKWVSGNKYIKADMFGYEGFAEALASELLQYIKTDYLFADYYLCNIHEGRKCYSGCYSNNFLCAGESLVSVMRILENAVGDINRFFKKYKGKELVLEVVYVLEDVIGLDLFDYLEFVIKFDAIILNEDRHFNNISVIYNELSNEFKFSPIFDNGLSLLSDVDSYDMYEPITNLIKKAKSKPFSVNFEKQCSYFSKKLLRIDYNGLRCSIEGSKDLWGNVTEYRRAVNVLLARLDQTRGILWQEI